MAIPINPDPSKPASDASIDEIQDDIEQTRRRLGETVDELSERLNVKSRAKQKVAANSQVVSLGAGIAAAAIVGLAAYLWSRR